MQGSKHTVTQALSLFSDSILTVLQSNTGCIPSPKKVYIFQILDNFFLISGILHKFSLTKGTGLFLKGGNKIIVLKT